MTLELGWKALKTVEHMRLCLRLFGHGLGERWQLGQEVERIERGVWKKRERYMSGVKSHNVSNVFACIFQGYYNCPAPAHSRSPLQPMHIESSKKHISGLLQPLAFLKDDFNVLLLYYSDKLSVL
jgi:hypothetical protein